jgi:tetratricopeptide (TPR) repeat protein
LAKNEYCYTFAPQLNMVMAKLEEVKTNPQPVAVEVEQLTVDPFEKAENLFKSNIKLIAYIAGGIVLAGAAIALFILYRDSRNEEGQKALFPAVYFFESDSLNLALKGNGNSTGLLDIAEEFSGTDAGNQAEFYIGVTYLKQGKYADAITHLENFSSSDALVQARAFSLIGDANMEQAKFDEAITWYTKATEYKPTKEFTPAYFLKLALAQEKAKDFAGASATYGKLVDTYPDAQEAADAKKFKAKAEQAAK